MRISTHSNPNRLGPGLVLSPRLFVAVVCGDRSLLVAVVVAVQVQVQPHWRGKNSVQKLFPPRGYFNFDFDLARPTPLYHKYLPVYFEVFDCFIPFCLETGCLQNGDFPTAKTLVCDSCSDFRCQFFAIN